jgi:hypothetical protein
MLNPDLKCMVLIKTTIWNYELIISGGHIAMNDTNSQLQTQLKL